jgi:DNA-binding response OmpR family regulator
MTPESITRVLVLDDDATRSHALATFLMSRHYDVQACRDTGSVADVLAHWRPHVLVLAPRDGHRHEMLEELRRLYPRLPLVVLTPTDGPDLLLDLEAFAPAMSAKPSRGLSNIESAVAAASAFAG